MAKIHSSFQTMRLFFLKAKERMAQSPGRELEQTLLRLAVKTSILIFILVTVLQNPATSSPMTGYYIGLTLFAAYMAAAFYWLYHQPVKTPARYIFNSLLDVAGLTYAVYLSGEFGAALYPIYLWVTFGYGFRFGIRYLIIASSYCVIGLIVLGFTSPFFSTHIVLNIGMISGVILLPLYFSSLLKRLHTEVEKSEFANNAKTQFLANMSHELRTPLNGILGASDLIKSTILSKEQKEYTDTIDYSVRSLLDIIENVLDISKIEAGKLLTESVNFDLHHLMKNTMRIMEHQAHDKGFEFTLNISPEVPYALNGDVNHLRQILMNLISNAIKFTDSGKVSIQLTQTFRNKTYSIIRTEVIDTGCGLSQEAQKKIFNRFTQADDSITRRYGGSGLGTSIAKQLVEKLGGTIGVASADGEGSTFWFEIPFLLQTINWEQNNDLSDARVLAIAEPDDILLTLIDNCQNWGVKLEDTQSGNEAIQIIDQAVKDNNPIHAIIITKSLIDVNTIHFARALRAKSILKHMSLILFSYNVEEKMRHTLLEAGFTCVLDYPVDMPLLFNAIHSAPLLETQTADNVEQFAAHYSHQKHPKKYNILLAEDNHSNQLVTRRILEYGGHEVVVVSNGEDALDMLEDKVFDLCIIDMHMPNMSGLQTAQLYKFMYPENPMPFVMLTANAATDAINECKQAGIEVYLTKPIKPNKLLSTISSLTTTPKAVRQAVITKDVSNQKIPRLYPADIKVTTDILNPEILSDLELLNENTIFLDELIQSFIIDGKTLIDKLQLAESDNFNTFTDLAHSLKNNASAVGATSLYKLCYKCNKLTLSEYDADARLYLKKLQKEFKQAQYALLRHAHEKNIKI